MPLASEPLLAHAGVVAVIPPAVAAIFWLWFIVAVVIWTVRLVRRAGNRGTAAPPPLQEPPPAVGQSAPAPLAGVVPPVTAPPDEPIRPLPDPLPDPAPPAIDLTDSSNTPFAGVAEPAGSGETGRTGFFAATPGAGSPGVSDGGRAVGGGRPTVVEALQGIVMPCNLSPVIDGAVSIPNPFRVAFLTADADAPTVGAALGDELQRLGFTLSTPAATELLARKSGTEVRVMLYPTASAARRGLDLIFPAAPDHAVGVEFTS